MVLPGIYCTYTKVTSKCAEKYEKIFGVIKNSFCTILKM